MNVYQAAINRIEFVFNNFENIYLSFSGGKDSGVLYNLMVDIARKHKRRFTVLYIDLEGMYKETVSFVERMFSYSLDVCDVEWVCLPLTTTNAVSMFEPYWTTWNPEDKDKWIRPLPPDAIYLHNNPYPFYYIGMTFEDFIVKYAKHWNTTKGKTACFLGIRTQESLNRWRAVNRVDVSRYKGLNYSVRMMGNTYNFYPIYDWLVEDVWTYNGKFGKDYNRIYDLMYRAGVPINKQRICEPYGDEQKQGLNLYKVLEPETWVRVVDRVSGANFGNIYCNTKATGARELNLPKGHTWKSYCKFLLKTLPESTRNVYTKKFITFIQYWRKNGSPLENEMVDTIKNNSAINVTKEYSRRGKGDKIVVKFRSIPDSITYDNKTDMLSWKRMCMAILKNDITCKSLSFSITKQQLQTRKEIIAKYKALL